jgi:hypothetical protein
VPPPPRRRPDRLREELEVIGYVLLAIAVVAAIVACAVWIEA